MRLAVYEELVARLALPFSSYPNFGVLARLYNVNMDSLVSIYSQESQLRVIKTHHLLKRQLPAITQRYCEGCPLYDISADVDFPPCIVARRILEALPLGLGKQRITEVLRNPAALPSLCNVGPELGSPEQVADMLQRITDDVHTCVELDPAYSPRIDVVRHTAGVEYEARLCEHLRVLDIAFWSEDVLRFNGYFKTPDIRLQVPIAIQGHLVNWIDSKATFGGERIHKQQVSEQYVKYVNRYGPGAVVYWFGFVDELQGTDADILLLDDFPPESDITTLPSLPLSLADKMPIIPDIKLDTSLMPATPWEQPYCG